MDAKEVSARWLKASRAFDERGPYLRSEARRNCKDELSSEGFYAFDDPVEAAGFSVLIGLIRELDKSDVVYKQDKIRINSGIWPGLYVSM